MATVATGSVTPALGAVAEGPPAVRLVDVSKTYRAGEVEVGALHAVSLDVPVGEFTVMLGPSGSGKTTLMNVIGGLEPPTGGSVEAAGVALASLDDASLTAYRRESVGFVFQFFNLVPTLTALENVQLVAELVGRTEADAARALEAVGLTERGAHFPASLSGGEQQRVAIARAVVKEPALLLCDEPTGSLDLETGRQVLAVLRRLSRLDRRTVIVVTHNSAIAGMADRVVRMRSGRIVDVQRVTDPVPAEEISW